ncbi:DsbA family protein [Microbacterium abyssi]|uniref:DsbA family protein n=1 Tax=Microbacterium abyssi TaxID=2782166 RepID=UPI0018884E66|nr:thioredoxin domain-containing protein [Microbacterium sp. A18JL241]
MAAQARKTNWFAIWISIGVVIALVAVGVLVVWLNQQQGADSAAPGGSIVEEQTGAILIGDGPDEVEIWFDFYCPHCQDFEDVYGPGIQDLVDDGAITLRLQPVALAGLNAASGTEFSERSGGALYCVADAAPDAAHSFFTQLFAMKPSGAGLTDDELSALAADVGASDAADCIADGTYRQFAVDQAQQLPTDPQSGGAGTPTLVVNGEYVAITGDVDADIVDRLNG